MSEAEHAYMLGYMLGRQRPPLNMSRATVRRILLDPTPSYFIKWWRRGFKAADEEKRSNAT